MLINKRCTVCHDDITAGDSVICGACENPVHKQCAEFERRFKCPECANEPEIGTVEF